MCCRPASRMPGVATQDISPPDVATSLSPMPLLPITSVETVRRCKEYRPTKDIFICSYPKSGTTWMQNILFQLVSKAELPLTHISDFAPFYEVDRTWDGDDEIAARYREGQERLGRRLFNTHLRWDMMPTSSAEARYVYLVRNGKDACVSFYHHLINQSLEDGGFEGTWEDYLEAWCEGTVPFGSWIDHLLSWTEALQDKRVLLLHYEDLKRDLRGCVGRLVEHCGLHLTPAQLETALSRMSFDYMSQHHALFQPRSVEWKNPAFRFIRKGQVGDHVQLFRERDHERFADMLRQRFGQDPPPELIRSKAT